MLFVVIYSLVSGALCAACAGELRQAFSMDCVTNKLEKPKILDLGKWLPWQQSLQPAVLLEHTDDSRMLVELLQYAVNKRCQIQPTQTAGEFCTTLRSGKEEILWQFTLVTCSPTPPLHRCVRLTFLWKRKRGGSYLLFIIHCCNHFCC